MGRPALAATSLVAAIPAIGLAVVTIMAFVQHADAMPTVMIAVNGTAVALAVLLAITPVAILVGGRSQQKEEEGAAEATEGGDDAEAAESVAQTAQVVSDEPEGELSEEMDLDEVGEMEESAETDAFEFDMDEMEDDAAAADDAFEFDDDEFK